MNMFSTFKRWFTYQFHHHRRVSSVDLALLNRCVRIVRGDEPGRAPRLGGPSFPEWGQADLEGRHLVWSGPFSFELDIQYQLLSEALPGVYVSDPRSSDSGRVPDDVVPLLTFVIAESSTWATLWPRSVELLHSKDE